MSSKRTYVEGREDQYREMMQQLGVLESKYKGVRGELLARVRAELEKIKPNAQGLTMVPAAPPSPVTMSSTSASVNPSCRVCGREMRMNGTDGRLVCQNGHAR